MCARLRDRAGVRARLRDRSCFVVADGRAALGALSFVASLQQKVELLCARDWLWLRFRGWPNCFACASDRVFVAADGLGLVARS